MFIILWALVAAPLFIMALNSMLNRFTRIHPHRTPFTAGAIAALAWIPMWLWACSTCFPIDATELVSDLVYGGLYLFCVVFLNWFIFTITDVSMHIQLLIQIFRHPGMARDELVGRYNKGVILGNRIPRLIELGQLQQADGRLFVAGNAVLLGSRVCTLLRWILGLPLSPADAKHVE
jgi:hypothetical protein